MGKKRREVVTMSFMGGEDIMEFSGYNVTDNFAVFHMKRKDPCFIPDRDGTLPLEPSYWGCGWYVVHRPSKKLIENHAFKTMKLTLRIIGDYEELSFVDFSRTDVEYYNAIDKPTRRLISDVYSGEITGAEACVIMMKNKLQGKHEDLSG
jgi:hypothetical protein